MAPTKENKDYCKRYRQKNFKKYREEDCTRKYLQMKLLDPEVYKLKCGAEAARVKRYRERKRAGLVTPRNAPNSTPEPSTPVASTPTSTIITLLPLLSQQNKPEIGAFFEPALPRSPGKRKEVVAKLAKKFDLRIALLPKQMKSGPQKKMLTDEQKNWVHEFLDRPDISYTTPEETTMYTWER